VAAGPRNAVRDFPKTAGIDRAPIARMNAQRNEFGKRSAEGRTNTGDAPERFARHHGGPTERLGDEAHRLMRLDPYL